MIGENTTLTSMVVTTENYNLTECCKKYFWLNPCSWLLDHYSEKKCLFYAPRSLGKFYLRRELCNVLCVIHYNSVILSSTVEATESINLIL